MEGLYGKKLDNVYRIDELVGRGGMGTVYKARDVSLERDVAIKVLHPHFADDATFRERFLQEARAIASLDHPDIVHVYAFGQDLGLLYIVMDFVPGQTLQDWLKRLAEESKIVALAESLTIARRIAMALHYAHEEGVLHRDVKPGNILLKPTAPSLREPGDLAFHPVLTDFGLAKLAEGGVHTQTGATMGTPAYMSPEQCLGLRPDRRSDIYSLGVILFELTTGRVPFEVKSLTEAIRCHTQEPPPPPRSINPALPVEVENVVLRALAKRQEDRYPDARQMARGLREAIRRVPGDMHVAPVSGPIQHPVGSDRTRLDPAPQGRRSTDPSLQAPPDLSFPPGSNLTVSAADEQTRRVSLGGRRSLTVGRSQENDLRIPDSQASRRHARIEFNGQRATVVDLNSTNGTYIGDSQLLPGITEIWTADKPLRIGGSKLYLELGQVRAPGPVWPGEETVLGAGTGQMGAGAGRIGVSVDGFDLSADPGSSVDTSFTIMNLGTVVDHFETAIHGLPPAWVPILPPVIRLLPNEEHEIRLTIHPPRSSSSRAGRYPAAIRITSQDLPDQIAVINGTLTLSAFHEFDISLDPQKQTSVAKGRFAVRLRNQGNADLTVRLDAMDPENGCLYAFNPARAIVPPEGQVSVELQVRARTPLPGEAERLYPFTVNAHPLEAPELARSAQGQWVQIAPSFEVQVRPQRQSGTGGGVFQVLIRNASIAEVDLQLEASDPEDGCTYTFDPPQLTVPPGQQRAVNLDVRPRIPLPGETSRTYPFTVSARPLESLGSAREAQGQWVQIAPAFEVDLRPQRQSGAGRGTFEVRVRNQSIAELHVALEATDAKGACSYAFSSPEIQVPGSQDRSVRLTVEPKAILRGKEPCTHAFSVTARPSAAPRFARQAQGEWIQVPRERSLWPPFLLAFAGWVAAWIVFWTIGRWLGEGVVQWLAELGVPWEFAKLVPWFFRGVIVGSIGGLCTGLALKWAEPSFTWFQALWIAVVWTAGWALGMAAVPLTEIPFYGGVAHILFWGIVGTIVGLIAGWLTGGALRRANPALRGGQVFLIGLAWALGWALGHLVVESLVETELIWLFRELAPAVILGVILGGAGGLIGGGTTFWALGCANRRPRQEQ